MGDSYLSEKEKINRCGDADEKQKRSKNGNRIMNKLKLFLENFLVYGFGGVISKIIPLIMLPIITRLMPDPLYYGLFDLSNTITSFGSALAVMGMYDAMFRYFFERDDEKYKRDICSTTLCFTIGTSLVVFFLMLIFHQQIALYIFDDAQYGMLVYLTAMATLVGATNGIISAPTRMQNQRSVFLVTNTVSPILGYAISIPLLMAGYYVIALPLAGIVSGFIMELAFAKLNRKWFSIHCFHWAYLQDLLKIAVPLAPTFLVYWIFNSCDRIMIADILGVDATGIYAIGSKLGMASQLIYTAFAGGWQYFAFSTMKDENQVKSNSLIMEYLGVVSFVGTMFICAISHWIYQFFFTGKYVDGYAVSGYLFLAPLLLMLYQVISNQLLVIKKTWPGTLILFAGAMANVGLNALWIPILGIEGAGLATLAGYVISLALMSILLMRMGLLVISRRFYFNVAILMVYLILWRLYFRQATVDAVLLALVAAALALLLYAKEIRFILQKGKHALS